MEVHSSIENASVQNSPVCMALGLFDGLHAGHMRVIGAAVEKARLLGLKSGVFTFSMRSAIPTGKRPLKILSPRRFRDILDQAGVDCVIRPDFGEFKDIGPESFINDILIGQLNVKHVFCGENFRFGKGAAASAQDIVRLSGGALGVEIIPMMTYDSEDVSSSRIRSLIESGDIPAANNMLGRRFSIDFGVVRGHELGRKLGTPTINQPFPKTFIVPQYGVYATLAKIEQKWYSSITNVGVKPTVGSEYPLAETYIHDFAGDLYGKRVRVDFVSFMRPERRFDNIDELKAQIILDSENAKRMNKIFLNKQ